MIIMILANIMYNVLITNNNNYNNRSNSSSSSSIISYFLLDLGSVIEAQHVAGCDAILCIWASVLTDPRSTLVGSTPE